MDMRMAPTLVLALIYVAGMFAFTVAFLVDWIRHFEQIRGYWRHGVAAGSTLIGLNLLVIAMMPGNWSMVRIIGFASLPVLFVRLVGFVMLGMYYCAVMGRPGFLFLAKELPTEKTIPIDEPPPAHGAGPRIEGIGPDLTPASAPISPETTVPVDPSASSDDPPVAEAVAPTPRAAPDLPGYVRDIVVVAAASVLYSALLFTLTKPHIGEAARRMFGVREDIADTGRFAPFAILLVLVVAVSEEIFFRLGIQNFLARYLNWQGRWYWVAIVLTSLLWTVGHAGSLDPNWVKLAQIFPVGLMLGWLFHRYGVEACVLAHGLLNVTMIGLTPLVMT